MIFYFLLSLAGPGGDTSNPGSELNKEIYYDPRLVKLKNFTP